MNTQKHSCLTWSKEDFNGDEQLMNKFFTECNEMIIQSINEMKETWMVDNFNTLQKSDENRKLKEFYLSNYDDELGHQITPKATFVGLFEVMDNYGDVYDYIGVADSVMRERIFNELSLTMGVSYNYVYEQYLLCI